MTLGLCDDESVNEVLASTQDTSKATEIEDHVDAFRRIIEKLEVLSPNSPAGPTDNYNNLCGQLKSKLVGIDFL